MITPLFSESGSYSNAAWAARQVEREAAEAAESGLELDEAVAAQHAAFAQRQASLLQVLVARCFTSRHAA